MNALTKTAWWMAVAPLFIIPFLAFYVSSELYFPFITGKNFAFRALVEISFFGWIVLAIADRKYRPRFSWILAAFALFVGWMAIANGFAVNPHKAYWSNFERMEGYVTIVHVLALFLVSSSVLMVGNLWRKWSLTFIASVALVCIYGLFQLLGVAKIHQSDTRLDASLGNAEYLGGYLLLALAFTLWQAFETRSKEQVWLRYSLLALAALEVVILVGTLTRGSVVALIGAAGFGALMWLVTNKGKSRVWAAGLLAAVVLLVGGFFVMRNSPVVTESPNLQRFASIFSLREALGTRITIWEMALEGAQERPVTGWGQEGYNYVFNQYYRPSLYGQEAWFDRAHNIYLDWLIAGGVPALLLFLALYGAALLAAFRARGIGRIERTILLAALVGYGIQGLAVFDNLFTYIPLALILGYLHWHSSRPIASLEKLPEVRGTSLQATAAVVAVVALLVLYMVNVPTYAAAKDLIGGLTPRGTIESRLGYFKSALEREPFATQEIREQLLQFAVSVATSDEALADTKAETIAFAEAQIQEEIKRAPQDARLYVQYATFLRAIGRFDDAGVQSAKALELSPNRQLIILEQGIGAWQAGDVTVARDRFNEIYALSPENDDAAVYAAAGRIINRDIAGGKEVLTARFGTTTVPNMVIALAYQRVEAWNELIPVLIEIARVNNDAISGYQVAIAYAQAGRLAEARAQVRTVMAAFPASSAQGTSLLTQMGTP